MTQLTSIKRRLPLSDEIIANYAKPLTKWNKLAIVSNEQVFKTYRTRGKIFSLIAAASTTGLIISFSYRKTDLVKVAGLLTVSSALVGLAYRYWGDTTHILKQREEVRNNIETFTLANIRSTYPDKNVISDQELNEWSRYFLHNQPFDKFLRIQWSSIFDFELEPDTIKLIKQKYFYRIYHPDNPKNLTLSNEVLNSRLFTKEEQVAIKKFQVIVREEFRISSVDEAQRKYFSTNLSDIPSFHCHVYAWLFSICIWTRGIGIEELRIKYVDAMEKFTPCFTDFSPMEYIANRDAEVLNYDAFIKKNGEEAIHYISNFPHFLKLILQPNLGLKVTQEKFKDDIVRFGAADQIKQAVLAQEWSQLVHLTYTQVRDRNGQDAILEVSDPNVKKQLKAKFLRLSPRELANKNNYKEEIKVLEVEDREIIVRLSQTWGEMDFKDILKLPPETRQLILDFSKKSGKTKAKEEINKLSVAEVLNNYQLLFQEGVLDLTDYDFTGRLERLVTHEVTPLLQWHGKFILEKELLQKTDYRVMQFVSSFIYDHRQIFLSAPDLPKEGVWLMFSEFDLIKKNCLALRDNTLKQLNEEKVTRHPRKVRLLESSHVENLQKISKEVQQQLVKLEITGKECKEQFVQAERNLKNKTEEQEKFLESCRDWETEVEQKAKIHQLEKIALEEMKSKKAEFDGIPDRLTQLEKIRLGYQKSLRDLQEDLKEKNKTSILIKTLEDDIGTLGKEIVKLNNQKFDLGSERDQIETKIQKMENPSQAADENLTEIEGLKIRSKKIVIEIDVIVNQVKEHRQQIRNKKQDIETALEDFSQYSDYTSLCEKIDETTKQYKALTTKQSELEKACFGLISLQGKINRTAGEINQFSEQKRNNATKARRIEEETKKLQDQKNDAEKASNRADKALTLNSTTLLETRTQEEDRDFKAKIQEENDRFDKATQDIQSEAAVELKKILQD